MGIRGLRPPQVSSMREAPCTGITAVPLLALALVSCSQDGRWNGEGAGPLLPCAGGGVGGWAEKELFLSITSQCRVSFPFSIPSRWVGELRGLQQINRASYPEGLGCLGTLSL